MKFAKTSLAALLIAALLAGCAPKKASPPPPPPPSAQSAPAADAPEAETKAPEAETEAPEPAAPEQEDDSPAELGTIDISGVKFEARSKHPAEEKPVNEFREGIAPPASSTLPRVDIRMEKTAVSKESYNGASVSISNAGDFDLPETEAKVKLRGNSTAIERKIPLKLKFAEKQQLFGGAKAKSWTLLANIFDVTSGLHNYTAYNAFRQLREGKSWESAVTFVDLYVNGAYQGVYTLCDQVEVGKDRIALDGKVAGKAPEDCDYLIEQDMRVAYEDSGAVEGLEWFYLLRRDVAFEIKSPESDEEGYDETYAAYISQYVNEAYEALISHDYAMIRRYFELDSFLDGMLVSQLVKNQDANKASVFLSKKAHGKLEFATLWDCDLAFGSGELGKASTEEEGVEANPIFSELLATPEIRAMYLERFNEKADELAAYINSLIDEAAGAHFAELENDYDQWIKDRASYCNEDMKGLSYEAQVRYMRDWLKERLEFLKAHNAE